MANIRVKDAMRPKRPQVVPFRATALQRQVAARNCRADRQRPDNIRRAAPPAARRGVARRITIVAMATYMIK
jgi:hypothetical protein